MVKYCKQDVNLLEQWFDKLNKYMKPKTHATGVKCDCPECGSDKIGLRGFRVSSLGNKTQRAKCKDCGKWFAYSTNQFKLK
jgi:transposase-like protein